MSNEITITKSGDWKLICLIVTDHGKMSKPTHPRYSAYDDNTYDGEGPLGWGVTQLDAIKDLFEQQADIDAKYNEEVAAEQAAIEDRIERSRGTF